MLLLKNRQAHHEYEIESTLMAGVQLTGPEVKSLRNKSGSFTGSYVKIIGSEVFLLNAQISPYKFADNTEYDPKRTRKLLLKKREIQQLKDHIEQKKRSLVPIAFELEGRNIKLKIGVGKGLKTFEKKAKLKKRDLEREMERGW